MKNARAWVPNSIAAVCLFILAATVWAGMGGNITQPPNVSNATGILAVIHGGTGNTTGYASGVPAAGVSGVLATSQGGTGASSYAACVGNACPLVYYDGATFATDPSRHISYDAASDVLYTNTISAASSVTIAGNLTVTGNCTGCGSSFTNSAIDLYGMNGFGSTCTRVPRFTTVRTNTGSDITYADSPVSGVQITINTTGIYEMHYTDNFNTAAHMGITLNMTSASNCATNINNLPASAVLGFATSGGNAYGQTSSWIGILHTGDIIQPHSDGTPNGAQTNAHILTISRVH